jgi:hypothetical protein
MQINNAYTNIPTIRLTGCLLLSKPTYIDNFFCSFVSEKVEMTYIDNFFCSFVSEKVEMATIEKLIKAFEALKVFHTQGSGTEETSK